MSVIATLAKIETPLATVYDKYFGGVVAMLRIYTLGWLTCPADIEAVRLGNMDCCSGFSDTPGPIIVKFSFASDPGERVSMKALKQGLKSA